VSFSSKWDAAYKRNEHQSVWPWSNLVSRCLRHTTLKKRDPDFRVLEVGCGAGANIPFFLEYGADYHGLDGSSATVHALHERFPKLKTKIVAGDFTESLYFDGQFDLIVDRAAITHNDTAAISRCLAMIENALSDGGIFIGCDWFSTDSSRYGQGVAGTDEFTRTDIADGTFADIGQVHFSSQEHIDDLFSQFKIIALDHILETVYLGSGEGNATWQIVAAK
jgi:cyclopropane fatty-acyl-phospholipid synthase-like methyltransferase